MRPKIVYWKRFNYRESGFNLLEFFEDGTIVKRQFFNHKEANDYYNEQNKQTLEAKGEIRIEKIDFKESKFLTRKELLKQLEVVETFPLTQWEKARKRVRELQKESHDDLTVDYHSMVVYDEASLPEEISAQLERFDYPIVKFRFNFDTERIQRLEYPEKVSIEFFPVLNERLYFHHFPKNNLLTMTGDDLFALHTEHHKEKITDEVFWDYIFKMLDDVNENRAYYHELITKQRERRAMVETDIIGDLYPR